MSLRVWLPLTKDLRNQGLDNVAVTNNGTTFNSAGKLGGCYTFDGTNDRIQISNLPNPKNISVAFWMKRNADTGTRQFMFTAWSGVTCELQANNSFHCGVYNNGSTVGACSNTSEKITVSSGWVHVVYTFEDKVGGKLYLNGSLISTASYSGSIQWGTTTGNIGYYSTYFNGAINDFRIYDHCLSPMEVKELSKGLVLHYPLNRQGWGQENLLLNSNDLTLWPIESSGKIELQEDGYFKVSSKASNTTRYGIYYDFTFPEPNTYTFSVDVRDDWLIGVAPASTFTWTTANLSGTQGTKRISYTCTSTEENNKCRIYIAGTGTGGRVTYLKHPKLEKGSVATPWCPNSSDALATSMDLNGITEYDCSGFCNNGIKNNIPTYSSDTVKYQVSTHLDGINQTIQLPDILALIPDSIFTFNIWFKRLQSEPSSKPWETLLGGPSGFEIETCSANNVHDNKIKAYSWGGGTIEFEFDKWNMLTMVLNGINALFYLNGELKLTGTYKALVSGNYFIGSWSNTATQNYKGYVCDARIYATALSADDVKSLYQNSAYIDSSGNVYGAVH